MARLKTAGLIVEGVLGDLVFKSWKGRRIICTKAVEYTYKDKAAHKIKTNRFTFSSKFSSALNKIKVFKELWGKSDPNNIGAYNCMVSCNNKKMEAGGSFTGLSLVPERDQFPAAINSYELVPGKLILKTQPLTGISGFNLENDPLVSMQGLLFLYNPIDPDNEGKYSFIPLFCRDSSLKLTEQMEFEFILTGSILADFNNKHILVNIITKNIQGEVKYISKNICLAVS